MTGAGEVPSREDIWQGVYDAIKFQVSAENNGYGTSYVDGIADAANDVLSFLGIRETCWRCGHKKDHASHDKFSVAADQHPYKPVLIVHVSGSEVSSADDAPPSVPVGPESP